MKKNLSSRKSRCTCHRLCGRVSKSEQNKNSPELFLPGFRIGKSGIELQYDIDMRGLPGTKRVRVNSLGKVIKSSIEKDTIKGKI